MIPDGADRDVDAELDRLTQRWHQLPLGQAVSAAEVVFAAAQALADATARAHGIPGMPLPHVHERDGPAIVMDQLSVTVFDATQAGVTDLAEVLRRLRADLR